MNGMGSAVECRPLIMHWSEQLFKECEFAIERAAITETAQAVLFYAGLMLESKAQEPSCPYKSEKAPWLAADEEVVEHIIPHVPKTYHGLLKLCLVISSLPVEPELTASEVAALRGLAVAFMQYVRERAYPLADLFH